MPRLVAATPKYRHHRASHQAVVTIAGRDRYLGPWNSRASKVEYDRLIGEWLTAGRPVAPPPAPNQATVMEVAAAFWRYAKEHFRKHGRSTGTAESYKPVLSLLKQRYGHTLAAEFGPLALKALRQVMIELGQSRRYANDNTFRIRKVFRWAASEQLIPSSVPLDLETVDSLAKGRTSARESVPVESVADTVVDATLPHLPKVVADMVRLQRLTGARPGEICAMRPGDIDRSGEIWKYVPAEHKTEHHGKQRMIYIGPKAQPILLPYLLRDAEMNCFRPSESETHRRLERHEQRVTPLSCGNRPSTVRKRNGRRRPGDCYINDTYRRAITRGCEVAFEMPDDLRRIDKELSVEEQAALKRQAGEWRAEHVWSPHQLRHTAATEIRHKFGLEAAQVSLGHSRMNVTEIYAEKNQELAMRVSREVG